MLEKMIVLDCATGYCGGFAGLTLANQGAKVYKIRFAGQKNKIEQAGAPFQDGGSHFYAYHNNKELVSLDLTQEKDIQAWHILLQKSHVLLEDFQESPVFTYEKIQELASDLVYAHIDGQEGDSLQANCGLMDMTGFPDGAPTKAGGHMIENFCGIALATKIVAGYFGSLRSNTGVCVPFDLHTTMLSIMESPILFETMLGISSTRCGNGDPATLVPYDVFRCKDGYFSAGLASDSGWDRFCEAIEMPELITDPMFATNEMRCKHYKEATDVMSTFFIQKTRDELTGIFTKGKIPNAPVLSVAEVMQSQQVLERNMICTDQKAGVCLVGNPIKTDTVAH